MNKLFRKIVMLVCILSMVLGLSAGVSAIEIAEEKATAFGDLLYTEKLNRADIYDYDYDYDLYDSYWEYDPFYFIAVWIGTFFLIMCILFLVAAVVGGLLVTVFMVKRKKLNDAMMGIVMQPCQQMADMAIDAFTNTNGLSKWLLSVVGRDSMHFVLWRDVFNNNVLPAANIPFATKEALRQQLVRFNTIGLRNVVVVQNEQQRQMAREAFETKGEDHLWNHLQALPECDVYRNVKIDNGATSSQIDAVIVDADKGIFLIETKTVDGRRAPDGNRYVF